MAKKKKQKYVDDGHTIYNMDIEGFKWHDKKKKKENDVNLSWKERWAMIRGAYGAFFPKFLIIIIAFTLTYLLLYFWLHH